MATGIVGKGLAFLLLRRQLRVGKGGKLNELWEFGHIGIKGGIVGNDLHDAVNNVYDNV